MVSKASDDFPLPDSPVMTHRRSRGISTFLLFATEAGRPLYDRLGFREVEQARGWLRGAAPHA